LDMFLFLIKNNFVVDFTCWKQQMPHLT